MPGASLTMYKSHGTQFTTPPPGHHGGAPWCLSHLVAHPNQPHPLPQTIHLPPIPPFIPSGPLPKHRSPLRPPPSPPFSRLQSPFGHRTGPSHQHPQATMRLSLLPQRLPFRWIPCIQVHPLSGPPDLLRYPNNIQAVLYLPYARFSHQGPKIYLPGYVPNMSPINPPTLVTSNTLPPSLSSIKSWC